MEKKTMKKKKIMISSCSICLVNENNDVICEYQPCCHNVCIKCHLEVKDQTCCFVCRRKVVDMDSKSIHSIQIRSLEGNTLDLKVNIKTMTIEELKFVLSLNLWIPVRYISLFFDGKRLLNHVYLHEYNISQNSVIFIDTRVEGSESLK